MEISRRKNLQVKKPHAYMLLTFCYFTSYYSSSSKQLENVRLLCSLKQFIERILQYLDAMITHNVLPTTASPSTIDHSVTNTHLKVYLTVESDRSWELSSSVSGLLTDELCWLEWFEDVPRLPLPCPPFRPLRFPRDEFWPRRGFSFGFSK